MKKYLTLSMAISLSLVAASQMARRPASAGAIINAAPTPAKLPAHPDHGFTLKDGTRINIRSAKDGEFNGAVAGRVMDDSKPGTQQLEIDNTDEGNCTVVYKKLSVATMDQDIMDDNAIGNIRIGGAFSLFDFQKQGLFNIANADINPIRIQLKDAGLQENEIVLANPTPDQFDGAVNQLQLRRAIVKPAISGRFQFTEVFSQQDLDLKVGFNYKGIGLSLNDKFNFSNSNKSRKFFLDFKETNYTAQAFISADGYFKTREKNQDNDMVYVDKINYGRRIMVFFESASSTLDMTNTLSVDAATVKMNMEAALRQQLQNTTFKVVSYGTKRTLTSIVTGIDQLREALAKYFDEENSVGPYPAEWGKPISYSLKYFNGDVAVASANVENIPRRTCVANPNGPMTIALNLMSIQLNGDADLYGNAQVRCFYANETEIPNISNPGSAFIFNIAQNAHYSSNSGVQIFGRQDENGNSLSNNLVNFKLGKQAVADGAFIRVYAWLNDYDGGSGDDYFEMRDKTGTDKYGNYKQIKIFQVNANCNQSTGKTQGCDFMLEAAEADGSCKMNFKWTIQ